ncbi:MAG: histone deacetylase [Chloroflexi bacterium]|nr:histone deacetylase [Chloroflexota bacterium]
MKAFYSDQFVLPLPEGHRFPMQKYALLRERIMEAGLFQDGELCVPPAARDEDLLLVHTPDYVHRVQTGALTAQEIRRIGFPWSPQMVERSRRSVGATIEASRAALADGLAANLAGGTHHAYPDHGEGFCVFNDVAVAARVMQHEGLARRILIIDTDVHQGNGTAAIFAGDDSVFTFSIHGAKNYPFHKERSSLDIELPDGSGDEVFLEALRTGLNQALDAARADLAFYIAGADPFCEDRLGRLSVSRDALAERDWMVFGRCRDARLPVVTVMGGGYARSVEDTVAIHLHTIRAAVHTSKQIIREK